MIKTRSKKIQELLFGSMEKLEGGLDLRAKLSIPQLDGGWKTTYWRGNEGLIFHLIERIEKLELALEKKKKK